MKFCIKISKFIELELSNLPGVDLSTYHQMGLCEYLYYLYCGFNLCKHESETLIPSFYSNSIQQIISTNRQAIDEDSFLTKCNLANFQIIIKRISDKVKIDEKLKFEIFSNSIFIINSNKISLNERAFLEFLLESNPSNIYYQTNLIWNLRKPDFDISKDLIIINDEISDKNEVVNLFLSYLAITVNARDQLRFCNIFNIPERKLNHHAFTVLRHESEQKNLSMSQIAFSYVTRLKLGGKSYAPSTECPLNKYVYGMSQLVDAMNKIQTVSEDGYQNPDKVAVIRKMLGAIKSILLQDKTGKFKKIQIEYILEKIMENIQKILSKDYVQVFDVNSTHICQIRNIIKGLLADYAIQPESYFDLQPHSKLGTPVLYNTPKGGCSKNLSNLYMSPDTVDSPILSKQRVNKTDIFESESLPAWPLHGKYQSDLGWIKGELTPPHVVQKFSKDRLRQLAIPDLNDEVSNDDLFNDIDQIVIAPLQQKISIVNNWISSTEINRNPLNKDKKTKFPNKRKLVEKPLSTIEMNDNKKERNSLDKTRNVKIGKRCSLPKSENKPLNKNKSNTNKTKSNKKVLHPNQKLITSFFSV